MTGVYIVGGNWSDDGVEALGNVILRKMYSKVGMLSVEMTWGEMKKIGMELN
jgi:hypothetical protein